MLVLSSLVSVDRDFCDFKPINKQFAGIVVVRVNQSERDNQAEAQQVNWSRRSARVRRLIDTLRGQPLRFASTISLSHRSVNMVAAGDRARLTDGLLDFPTPLFTSTQYWPHLTSDQPLARKQSLGFRVGDRLLIETDRDRFPPEEKLFNRMSVVQFIKEDSRL